MIRGIYAAATGMLADQYVQDAIASNLANLNTVAYKQDAPTFRSLQDMALRRYEGSSGGVSIGSVGLGTVVDGTHTSLAQGPIEATGGPLDVALSGSGFIAVDTPAGERYTRDGKLNLQPGAPVNGKPAAYLVDENGNRVLGTNGAIDVGSASKVSIGENGAVIADGVTVDTLKLVDAPDGTFTKQGGNLFQASGPVQPAKEVTVRSGYLEGANISAVGGMVRMVTIQRAYDAAQKAITSQDDELNKVITEVGKT